MEEQNRPASFRISEPTEGRAAHISAPPAHRLQGNPLTCSALQRGLLLRGKRRAVTGSSAVVFRDLLPRCCPGYEKGVANLSQPLDFPGAGDGIRTRDLLITNQLLYR